MILLYSLIAMFVLYSVGIQHERKTLWMPIRVLCAVVAVVGLTLDVLLNPTVFSLLMLDVPKEFTFSSKLHRLRRTTGWRGWLADKISVVLDWIAPYGHIN